LDDPIGGQLLIQLLLILVNAFFAATEIAVISLNDNKVRKQAEDGDKKAAVMLKLAESPNDFLSTIQVCITLSGFLASAFAADHFASRLSNALWSAGFTVFSSLPSTPLCLIVITLILSYFTLVLGELTPKRIAMKNPDKVARFSCNVIVAVQKFFKPIVWLLSKSTNAMLRQFRINPKDMDEKVPEEEIRMMVDIGGESGTIQQDERTMIENIFEFNNTTAESVMVHRMDVVTIQVEETFEEILNTIRESGLSRFPVYDEDVDDIVGVLNTRDFLLNAKRRAQNPPGASPPRLFGARNRAGGRAFSRYADPQGAYGDRRGRVRRHERHRHHGGPVGGDRRQHIRRVRPRRGKRNRPAGRQPLALRRRRGPGDARRYAGYRTAAGRGIRYAGRHGVQLLYHHPEDGSKPEVDVHGLHVQVEEISEHRIESALVSKILPPPETETPEETR
jgi:putative hemolysin